MRIFGFTIFLALALASASVESDAGERNVFLAQSNEQPVFFRTADLRMAFIPEAFTEFPLKEYENYGIRGAAATLAAWSGLKVKESNTAPNFSVLRGRGFDQIIESDETLTQSVLMRAFGSVLYRENVRRHIGTIEYCFVHHVADSDFRIYETVLMVNTDLPEDEEALCVLRGMASAFGIVDWEVIENGVSISEGSGRAVLSSELKEIFSEIYVF